MAYTAARLCYTVNEFSNLTHGPNRRSGKLRIVQNFYFHKRPKIEEVTVIPIPVPPSSKELLSLFQATSFPGSFLHRENPGNEVVFRGFTKYVSIALET